LREELRKLQEQRRRYNLLGFALGLPGVILNAIAGVTLQFAPAPWVWLFWFFSLGLFISGLAFVAKYKGRNPAWGLSLFGLPVLAVLKDLNYERIMEIKTTLGAMGESV
jgi:hypothetical protein